MSVVIEQRIRLAARLHDVLGDFAAVVTDDAQKTRPQAGKVAVLIEPPDLDYPTWGNDPEITWRVDIVAGTAATQAANLALIVRAIDLIAADPAICLTEARPVTYSLAGVGELAAYQLTINPSDI